MDETTTDWAAVTVPLHWAGYTRELEDGRRVWCCGACPNAGACASAGKCVRATQRDFELGDERNALAYSLHTPPQGR